MARFATGQIFLALPERIALGGQSGLQIGALRFESFAIELGLLEPVFGDLHFSGGCRP